MNRLEKLTKGEMLELGMLISYLEASCILQVGKTQISNLVKEKRLEQVVYKNRRYITLESILLYSRLLQTGDIILFMERVSFKPADSKQLKRNKPIEMKNCDEWHDFWIDWDKQLKDL